MANVLYLLVLLASLAVWQSAADDACASVECLPSSKQVCALDEQSGDLALFADECVLRCAACRTGTDFKKVNSSLCSTGARYITVCPEFVLNEDNEETKSDGSGDGMVVVEVDMGPEGSGDLDGLLPMFRQSGPLPLPLPLPLLPMGSEFLRRLVLASQPEPPPPPPEGLTLISADVKVEVTINLPPPPPPPPGVRPPVALPLLVPLPPPRHHHQPQPQRQQYAWSAALPTARPALSTAFAALVAIIVAAVHI